MFVVLEMTLDLETTIQNESIDHSVFLENESRLTSDTDMAFQFLPHLLESETETRPQDYFGTSLQLDAIQSLYWPWLHLHST